MKLEKWALIAEIVGALAIVVSLVFVGVEIGDNTRATQNATFQQVTGDQIEVLESLSTRTPEFLARFDEYAHGNEPLPDGVNSDPAWFMYFAVMRGHENQYLQHLNGSLADWAWCSRKRAIDGMLTGSGVLRLQEDGVFSKEFNTYIAEVRRGGTQEECL